MHGSGYKMKKKHPSRGEAVKEWGLARGIHETKLWLFAMHYPTPNVALQQHRFRLSTRPNIISLLVIPAVPSPSNSHSPILQLTTHNLPLHHHSMHIQPTLPYVYLSSTTPCTPYPRATSSSPSVLSFAQKRLLCPIQHSTEASMAMWQCLPAWGTSLTIPEIRPRENGDAEPPLSTV
ncbi:hypothetical protein IQ06DRAFT_305961 [Phaeosphaeriaceae sp. SRC1lsM3a]|nr:hypothetical protein IQ06DRAFT_305961 [Stagonospora sp. SRC1lsM3a]